MVLLTVRIEDLLNSIRTVLYEVVCHLEQKLRVVMFQYVRVWEGLHVNVVVRVCRALMNFSISYTPRLRQYPSISPYPQVDLFPPGLLILDQFFSR